MYQNKQKPKLQMDTNEEVLKILMIDDDEDDFLIAGGLFKKIQGYKFSIEWCAGYKEALAKIDEGGYHIYIVDYFLGAHTGLDLIEKACKKHGQLPFILLTGNSNQQLVMQAMKSGAMDYLVKNELDVENLERSVRYLLERTKVLKALWANEKKFRVVYEKSNDAILLTNTNFQIIDCNPAAGELMGSDKSFLLNRNLREFIDPKDLQEIKNKLDQNIEVEDFDLITLSSTKEIKYCLFSATLENNNDNLYYQCIVHDISALKKAEINKIRVEKREMIDRMVQALAHEVRNPLNNINLSIEQLASEMKDSDPVYIDIIKRNSERIQDLIDKLLLSSRSSQLNLAEVILQDLINEVVKDATDRIILKKVDLQLSLFHEPLYIEADAEKLKIALLNIINNAIEALGENGTIKIGLELKGNRFELTIADNGCGIPAEQLPKLFDPYHTTKRNGMGLGLATTINILHSHNVDVDVQSEVNVGTEFLLGFPYTKDSAIS